MGEDVSRISASGKPIRAGPTVKIFTLSQFRIEVDGAPLRFGQKAQRKPMMLLKLLIALGGDSVSVETVTDSLWPDSEGDQAQGAFSTTLHRLRHLIGHDSVQLANARLTLNPESCWVDGWAFTESLDQAVEAVGRDDLEAVLGHSEQALALYSGPFLDGDFDLPEILSAREKLHGTFLRQIEHLGGYFLNAGQHTQAIALYLKGLEIDPLAEELYQQLMRCYQQLGRYAEGVSVYQRLRDNLHAHAGIDPSLETETLHDALMVGKEKPTAPGSGSEGESPGEAHRAYPPIPDKPSIAVLPFVNLSGDPEQEYFADGLTVDIITDLSCLPGLFVIARNATFSYKGNTVTTRQVGEEMGVRYILEGSVRKSGGRVRITAQLIEAATGQNLWAKRYDRVLEDVFTVQDELTEEIVTTLDVALVQGETGRYYRQTLKNPDAREDFYRGLAQYEKMTPQDDLEARKFFEQVIQLEPDSPLGYAYACWYYSRDYIFHWHGGRDESVNILGELSKKALALNEHDPTALLMVGRYHLFMREHDLALKMAEMATTHGPNMAVVWRNLGWIQNWAGVPNDAIQTLRQAIRFSPILHPVTAAMLGTALRNAGQMEAAESTLKSALDILPGFNAGRIVLATIYGVLGREKEAKAEVREMLRTDPNLTVTKYATPDLYKNRNFMEQWLSPLRKAGLPE